MFQLHAIRWGEATDEPPKSIHLRLASMLALPSPLRCTNPIRWGEATDEPPKSMHPRLASMLALPWKNVYPVLRKN